MIDIQEKVKEIQEKAIAEMNEASGLDVLNDVRVAFLGKKGSLTAVLKSMKDVAPEDRPKVGKWVNDARFAIEEKMEETRKRLDALKMQKELAEEEIDVTLPAKMKFIGHRHPNTIALEEVERIFVGMGYEVIEGPEIEYDDYNFTKLNIPEGHPARDGHQPVSSQTTGGVCVGLHAYHHRQRKHRELYQSRV